MTRRRLLSTATLLGALALPACSTTTIWDKEGGNQADFAKDSYRCTQESSTGVSYVGVNYGYGVGMVNGRRTQDVGLYRMCMQAAGYTMRSK